MSKSQATCVVCGVMILVHPYRLKRTARLTCGRRCKGIAHSAALTNRGQPIQTRCSCGRSISVKPYRLARSRTLSCSRRCARNATSKLSPATVAAIRRQLDGGETQTELAIAYRVSRRTIQKAATRETWSDIA